MDSLIQRFGSKKARIGIIGLGYVGLPLAMCYQRAGYQVLGFDVDENKVSKLRKCDSYIKHIADQDIADILAMGFYPTTDYAHVHDLDAIIVCVPTPLNQYREPDLSYVLNTLDSLSPYLKSGQVISLESTTYPGTTEEEIVPRLKAKGFTVGEDFFVVYSPEREDPGNPNFSTQSIPKVLGGHTKRCTEVGLALYRGVIDQVVPVSSTKTAEMVKLLENIHRSVNIGLVNEMKIIADRMGIDIYEVIEAAASKPFGFTPYYPGPGVGGHCIPIDPFYLTWKAREFGLHTRFIELAGEINCHMPKYVVQKVIEGLNEQCKPVKGSQVLVLGLAYKKNVDDVRESPAVYIMEILRDKGAKLAYSDPHVPVFPVMREHQFDLQSVELSPEVIEQFDCVILATAHDDFDYDLIAQHAKLLVDTRGKFREVQAVCA